MDSQSLEEIRKRLAERLGFGHVMETETGLSVTTAESHYGYVDGGMLSLKLWNALLASEERVGELEAKLEAERWRKVEEGLPEKKPGEWFWVTDGLQFDVAIVVQGTFLGHRQLNVTHYKPITPPENL